MDSRQGDAPKNLAQQHADPRQAAKIREFQEAARQYTECNDFLLNNLNAMSFVNRINLAIQGSRSPTRSI